MNLPPNAMVGLIPVLAPLPHGRCLSLQFDELLVCAGRLPNVESLGLPAAGVGLTKEGRVSIDDQLQTENPNVYAVGDCCMSTQFTHVAVSSAPAATL